MDENDSSSASVQTKISITTGVEQPQEENDSCDSPSELEIDNSSSIPKPKTQTHPSPQHFLQACQEKVQRSPQRMWSPQHLPPARRTSLTDCMSQRSLSHSPKLMTHSYSHSSFPSNPVPQFQCYTPYSIHNINQYNSHDMYQSLPPLRLLPEPFFLDDSKTTSLPYQEICQQQEVTPPQSPSPNDNNNNNYSRASNARGSSIRKTSKPSQSKSSFEDYEERMLPALRQ